MIGRGRGACPVLATGWPGFALLPGSAHTPRRGEIHNKKSGLVVNFDFTELILEFVLFVNKS